MAEEVRMREVVLPLFILLILLCGAAWVITTYGIDPLIAGVLAVELVALTWIGSWMARKGILKKQDVLYYYLAVFVVVILTWGLIISGYIPIITPGHVTMDKFHVYALTTAMTLGLFIFIVILMGVAIIWFLYQKKVFKAPYAKAILPLLLVVPLLFSPLAYAAPEEVSVTVVVYDETGKAAGGVIVYAYDTAGTKIAEKTTNSSGYVEFSIPNATTTFVVKYTEAKWAFKTVSDNLPSTVTINASAMNYAEVGSEYYIEVKVTPSSNTKVTIPVHTNFTAYATESLNMSVPKEFGVAPFVMAKFENATIDGAKATEPTFSVDISTESKTVTIYYTQYYTFTWSIEEFIIIGLAVIVVLLLVFAFAVAGKALVTKPKKYLKVGSS